MYYDNPFLTEEQRTAMKAATAAAHLMTDLKTASAGLKHVKAIATFDEEVADLPLFPDLRQCGGDSQKFADDAALMMANVDAMSLDLHDESKDLASAQLQSDVDEGRYVDAMNLHGRRAVAELQRAELHAHRLTHFLQLRQTKHNTEGHRRRVRYDARERDAVNKAIAHKALALRAAQRAAGDAAGAREGAAAAAGDR